MNNKPNLPVRFEPTTNKPQKRTRRKNNSIVSVFASSICNFLIVVAFLGAQIARGNDPQLGSAKPQTAQVKPSKVTIRKVVITKKITTIVPAKETSSTQSPAVAQSSYTEPATQTYNAPQTYSAPAAVQTATS